MTGTALDRLQNGLIVSCQAAPGSPLANRGLMSYMAEAAEAGGAAAIRAEGLRDIAEIKKAVSIPIVGLIKLKSESTPVVITPLLEHVYQLLEAGVDLIAVDATLRKRVDGTPGNDFVAQAKAVGAQILADIDDLDSAIAAEKSGAITPGLHDGDEVRFSARISNQLSCPVVNLKIADRFGERICEYDSIAAGSKECILDIRQKVTSDDVTGGSARFEFTLTGAIRNSMGAEISVFTKVVTLEIPIN